MSSDKAVSEHYAHGDLLKAIQTALPQLGKTIDNITIEYVLYPPPPNVIMNLFENRHIAVGDSVSFTADLTASYNRFA